MGLDITAYERAEPLPAHDISEACYDEDDHQTTFAYAGFEQSFRGLPIISRDEKELRGPCVRVSGKCFDFRAGSYHGYNVFRDALARAALSVNAKHVFENPDTYRDQPFFELVNFADNEGTIGPEACADLANDFREHPEVRDKLATTTDGGWYAQKFDEWAKAFALAAGTGIVDFH